MRKVVCLGISLTLVLQVFSQVKFKKNYVYTEILGNGLVLSINYERQLGNSPGWGIHFGTGLGGDLPAFPLGVKHLWNLNNNKSFFEAGAGITIAEAGLFDEKKQSADHIQMQAAFIPSIGYRHQTDYGLMWRVNYTPFFSSDRTEFKFFGISVGWRL